MLIIFSPFAFISLAVPILSKVEYVGWENWSKRLLKVSFMAPIFMFFMYFIFKLVEVDIFADLINRPNLQDQGTIETIMFTILPALLILILLMKATSFAKKSSGTLGEALFKGVGV